MRLSILLLLLSSPGFAAKTIMEGIASSNNTVLVDTANVQVSMATATITQSGYMVWTGNSALGGASTSSRDLRLFHAAEGRLVMEPLGNSQISAFDIYPTTSTTQPTNEGLAEVTIHKKSSKVSTATNFEQFSMTVLPWQLGGYFDFSMEAGTQSTSFYRDLGWSHDDDQCWGSAVGACIIAGQEEYLVFRATRTFQSVPIDYQWSHILFSQNNQIGLAGDYFIGRQTGMLFNAPTGGQFNFAVNGSTITQVTATGLVMTSGNNITQSGGGGYLTNASSVTASAFFGDGNNITNINPANVGGAWSTWVPVWTGFSADPTVSSARYIQIGKLVIANLLLSLNGTSNATTFTVTLPVAAKAGEVGIYNGQGTDNGANLTSPARGDSAAASTTCTLYKDWSGAAWTATGGKGIAGTFIYEAN